MDFGFLPYQLNTDLSDLRDNIEYLSSENGVDLYKAKDEFIKPVLAFPVTMISLYFFEGSLITTYIHLGVDSGQFFKVRAVLDSNILIKSDRMVYDSGDFYYWQSKEQVISLIIDMHPQKVLKIYNSLNKFNIFDPYF